MNLLETNKLKKKGGDGDHYLPTQKGTNLVIIMCHLGLLINLLSITHPPHLQNQNDNSAYP